MELRAAIKRWRRVAAGRGVMRATKSFMLPSKNANGLHKSVLGAITFRFFD